MSELKAYKMVDEKYCTDCVCVIPSDVYIKSEADELISTIRAERDEYRYNLSCARNEIHNLSMSMREDVKTIADLKDKLRHYPMMAALIESGNKEIAELKGELQAADKQIENLITSASNIMLVQDSVNDTKCDELRHQKYKRCLAMAQEWRSYATFCGMQSSWHNNRGFGKTAEKWTWKECHAWTCVKRWMELAEKFKEAK